jgi:plasmid stabilization system protein ParE
VSRRPTTKLLLTQRALRDVQAIFDYSSEHWGKKAADKYLDEIESGLERLKAQPSLLKPQRDFHPALMFYRVNRHLLVCDALPGSIVVLTMVHASMDIPARLAELQPTLIAEVELLHGRIQPK